MPILYFRPGDTGSWSKAKPMISRLLGRLQKPANASRASKPQMARFIPNAEIHEPCAMGGKNPRRRGPKSFRSYSAHKESPGNLRLCENWGESDREGRIDNDAVFS